MAIKNAGDGTWTHTILLPQAPEACASANSATPANKYILSYFSINVKHIFKNFLKKIISWNSCKNFKYFTKFCWHDRAAVLSYNLQTRREWNAQFCFIQWMRKCWNWQTGKTKDLVSVTTCGFKSHLPHWEKGNLEKLGFFFSFLRFVFSEAFSFPFLHEAVALRLRSSQKRWFQSGLAEL